MNDREFTLKEARSALVVIRAVFETLCELQQEINRLSIELRQTQELHRGNGRGHEAHERSLIENLERLSKHAQRLLREVEVSGAEVKSLEQGLLDFPAVIDGTSAYWCWKVGELEISWWHPRDRGFADRRRIDGQ
jgi:hypothetical protein